MFDIILKLKGYNLKRAENFLKDSSNLMIGKRTKIIEYHRKHNPLYKQIVGAKQIVNFEDLPIVTKRDFQSPLCEIISDEYKLKDLYVANTSGSSGHPFYYVKNKDAHAVTHAIIRRLYAQHGILPGMKQARFYGIPVGGMAYYKEKLKDLISNRVRFPIFDLSDEHFEKYLQIFKEERFDYVYGYTSAIVLFAKFLHKKTILLRKECPSLKLCIVTSEVCTPEDKFIIEKAFGVKVVNEYGCSEAGLIAFDDVNGNWRIVEGENYFEVVDANGKVLPYGNEGRILITSLTNKAMPIIRYEVGDIGIIDKTDDGLFLRKLSGRVSDVIKLPSGRIAGGLTFYYVSRSILEKNNFVREFIVRQTKIDTFVFDIVATRDLTMSDIALLQSQLDLYLEPGLKLEVNRVDQIFRPASGKIKHFYSELNNN